GCGGNQHEVIGGRIAGDVGVEVVAESELLRIGPVRLNVSLLVLLAHDFCGACEPGGMVVAKSTRWGIGSVRQTVDPVYPGIGPEVAIKSMILFEDDDDVVERAFGNGCIRTGPPTGFRRLGFSLLNAMRLRSFSLALPV